jgi:ArsR family transcriptional regulator, arsenate/arsenite/antimonite-responsive transcriptional repressor
MQINKTAEGFSALGNETRLGIFRLLVQAGEAGLSTGRIASEIDIPLSTLAHHLDALTRARLVNQRKTGREVTNTANYPVMQDLIDYLTQNCCQGIPQERPRTAAKSVSAEILLNSDKVLIQS